MISDKDFERFIGRKTDYYLRKWESPLSFNFSAGFFGPLWFIYRKMYLIGFFLFLFNFVAVTTLYVYLPFHLIFFVPPIYSLLSFIIIGGLSNLIYKIKVSSSINFINNNYSGEFLLEKYKLYGGTDLSFVCGVLVFIFWFILFAILFVFTFIYEDFMNFISIEDNV
jgi:hypothetical protein